MLRYSTKAKAKQVEKDEEPELSWKSVRIPLSHIHVSPERISFQSNVGICRQGGFGDVHRAVLHATNQAAASSINPCCPGKLAKCLDVAVKKLRLTAGLGNDRIEKQISREVFVMSKLHHKNIVKLLGYHLSPDEGEAWLISNWVSGGNARDHFAAKDAKSKGHDVMDKIRLVADACEGLLYLHSRDQVVCHGDLKAQNLLVQQPHGRGQLCDFGLASLDDPIFRLLISTSRPQGTIPWSSPSVLLGGKLSPPDDIWSFGSLAYEIITGNIPFTHDGENVGKIVLSITQRRFPSNISDLPDPFGPLIQGCWKDSTEGQIELADALALLRKAYSRMEPDSPHSQKLKRFDGESCRGDPVKYPVSDPQDPRRDPPDVSAHPFPPLWAPNYLSFSNPPSREPTRSLSAGDPTFLTNGESYFRLLNVLRGCLCICGPPLYGKRIPRQETQDPDDGSGPSDPPPSSTTNLIQEIPPEVVSQNTTDTEISVTELKSVVAPQRFVTGRSNGLLRAKLEPTGDDVAVKVLSDVKDALIIMADPLGLRRQSIVEPLRAYIRSSSDFRHPRINPVLGYILVDGIPSPVTPWCANGNIEDYLQRSTAIDRWNVIDQVAEGLESLHSRDPPVIHASLKPENILVDDFGNVRLAEVGNMELLEQLTSGVTTCGKLSDIRWLPRIQEGWTVESDIYCFGLLVLVIITGKSPYNGLSDIDIARKKSIVGFSPADGSDLSLDSPLLKLLSRSWDVDPTKRPSISELRAEFKKLAYPQNSSKLFSTYQEPLTGSTKPGRYLEMFNNYCQKERIENPKTANDTAAKGQKPAWMATINLEGQLFVAGPTRQKNQALDDAARMACLALGLIVEEDGMMDGGAI